MGSNVLLCLAIDYRLTYVQSLGYVGPYAYSIRIDLQSSSVFNWLFVYVSIK